MKHWTSHIKFNLFSFSYNQALTLKDSSVFWRNKGLVYNDLKKDEDAI